MGFLGRDLAASWHRKLGRRPVLAVVTALAVGAGVLQDVPVSAATNPTYKKHQVWSPPNTPLSKTKPVPVGVASKTRMTAGPLAGTAKPAAPPPAAPLSGTWPASGSAPVTVPAAGAAPVEAGTLPVWIAGSAAAGTHQAATTATGASTATSASSASTPSSATVSTTVLDHSKAADAGVDGVILTVTRTDTGTTAAAANVTVNYAAFAGIEGGGFGSRLRLVSLPACALTTPAVPSCRVQTPLKSVNSATTNTVSAQVTLAGAGSGKKASAQVGAATQTGATAQSAPMVLAASAGTGGAGGSFSATPISASDSWSAGDSSGSFTYSYPITVPPTLGGAVPRVELGYSSSSSDGKTAANSPQTSWIGEGWDYEPGEITRQYKPCAKDGIASSDDLCWGGNHDMTLSMPGHAGEIVQDDANGSFHVQDDDGAKITRLTAANNGTSAGVGLGGEAWLLQTADGTSYYFGLNHLPGGNGSDAATNSAYYQPVYSPNSGDPCYSAGSGAASWCQMAWSWKLDYVVDVHGNLITYTYAPETNYYSRGAGQNSGNGALTQYVRGGVPASVSYGYRLSDAVGGTRPAAQVQFGVSERCTTSSAVCQYSNLSASTASNWPDVPQGEMCTSTTCGTGNWGPAYFSTKRLTSITTQVLVGSGYQTVDSYALVQQFLDPGDGATTSAGTMAQILWLNSVTRTGSDGLPAISLPVVSFTPQLLPNRVYGQSYSGSVLPLNNRPRMQVITDETGGQINVNFAAASSASGASSDARMCDAAVSGRMPSAPATNTMLCYPEYWAPSGATSPIMDWFNKYIVTSVTKADQLGWAPERTVSYTFDGAPAWRSDDSETVDPSQRTWDDFRGFGEVETRNGGGASKTGTDPIQLSVSYYLRGMDGDTDASGTAVPTVTVKDSQNDVITDDNALAGFAYEQQTFDQSGGKVVTDVLHTPQLSAPTASHKRPSPLPVQTARMQDTTKTVTRTLLHDGTWRSYEIDYGYDSQNRLVTTDDKGDGSAGGEVCTSAYYAAPPASNPMMLEFQYRALTLTGACGQTPTATNTMADTRTLYDGATDATVAILPANAVGNVTGTEKIDHYDTSGNPVYVVTGTATFDAYGRALTSKDPATGAGNTTVFTPTTGALPTQVATTNPMNWTATTVLDPGRQLPIHVVDANGRVTDENIDSLGRITQVWLPGRSKATQTPDKTFSYSVLGAKNPVVEGTQTLREDGSYASDYVIYDGMMQVRQEQSTPADGSLGRIVTDTYHNSLGVAVETTKPFYDTSANAPTTALAGPFNDANVPGSTVATYDGLGRQTASTFYAFGQPQWTDTTVYRGADETDVNAPSSLQAGTVNLGTSQASTTIFDAWGRTTQTWAYHGSTATGNATDADVTNYSYYPDGQAKAVTDPAGNTTRFTYDLRGRPTQTISPDSGTTTVNYDADGQVASTTDARGKAVSYTYDLLGRKTAEYAGTNTSDSTQLLASWSYDSLAKGYADGSTRYVGGANGEQYTEKVNGYTAAYQPTGNTVQIPGNEAVGIAGTYSSNDSYTPNVGLLDHVDMPAAGGLSAETMYYSYNINGLLVSTGGNADYLTDMQYDAYGAPLRTTLGDMPVQAVQTDVYDEPTGRLIDSTVDKENGTTHADLTSYTYDLAGRLTSARDLQDSGTVDQQCYGFDGQGRLTAAWTDKLAAKTAASPSVAGMGGCSTNNPTAADISTTSPAPYWKTYSYDVVGDRTSAVDHDLTGTTTKDVTRNYALPAAGANQPHASTGTTISGGATGSDTFIYDADGNTITRKLAGVGGQKPANQSLTYDNEGRLTQVIDTASGSPQTTSYLYGADGDLLIQKDPTETILYLGGEEVHLKNGATLSGIRYVDTPGGPEVIEQSNGQTTYEFSNQQGTGTVDIDASSLQVSRRYFDPYGVTRGPAATTWPDERGFLNKPQDDATQLTLVGARAYDSGAGRFLSVDPEFQPGGSGAGGYSYGNADPVDKPDPTGLRPIAPDDDPIPTQYMTPDATGKLQCDQACGQKLLADAQAQAAADQAAWDEGVAKERAAAAAAAQAQAQAHAKKKKHHWWQKAISFVAGAVVGGGCEAVLAVTLVGSMACGAVAGAVSSAIDYGFSGDHFSWSGLGEAMGQGAVAGALGGALGFGAGKLIGKAADAVADTPIAQSIRNGAQDLSDKLAGGARSGMAKAMGEEGDSAAASAARSAGDSCLTKNSFTSDTPVLMADGTAKPISQVKVGDKVAAADPQTGERAAEPVDTTIRHSGLHIMVALTLATGVVLNATDGHPFWDATTGRFTDAVSLKVGDQVLTADGQLVTIAKLTVTRQDLTAYNIGVSNIHTYYVEAGGTPVLVHNCGTGNISNHEMNTHILPRHDPNHPDAWTVWSGKSKFEDWVTPGMIRNWAKLAMKRPVGRMNVGTGTNHEHILDLSRSMHPIGYDASGNELHKIAVWVDNAGVHSVHPTG